MENGNKALRVLFSSLGLISSIRTKNKAKLNDTVKSLARVMKKLPTMYTYGHCANAFSRNF